VLKKELEELIKFLENNLKDNEILGLTIHDKNNGELLFSACCIDLEKYIDIVKNISRSGLKYTSIKSPIGYITVVETKNYVLSIATKNSIEHLLNDLKNIVSKIK